MAKQNTELWFANVEALLQHVSKRLDELSRDRVLKLSKEERVEFIHLSAQLIDAKRSLAAHADNAIRADRHWRRRESTCPLQWLKRNPVSASPHSITTTPGAN